MGFNSLRTSSITILIFLANTLSDSITKQDVQKALNVIHDVSSGNLGPLCLTEMYRTAPIHLQTGHLMAASEKVDMAGLLVKELGLNHRNGLADAITHSLVASDENILLARIVTLNVSSDAYLSGVTWRRPTAPTDIPSPVKTRSDLETQKEPVPWLAVDDGNSSNGFWTFPYFSCNEGRWLISYSVPIPPVGRHTVKGLLSVDMDVSEMDVNQCEKQGSDMEIDVLRGSHKCHNATTQCVRNTTVTGWFRGNYQCQCRPGYFSFNYRWGFNGSLVETAWGDKMENISRLYDEVFTCRKCAPGCDTCQDLSPCLAYYNWPFRITLLVVSLSCVGLTLCLIGFVYKHRRLKVFKVASPIFLSITLCGCSIMYLEVVSRKTMVTIFPFLDTYWCIATKWNRHLGFCITYTALLMKTWRVSLTYRVKSAHKVKLTDKQLLQWMFPILLVMLIYLGAWTFSDPPTAVNIEDSEGLKFKQCSFNWWDHSLAIGEVLFLAWGIKVCYSVRNAESFYNEAQLISYAIYNIAIVNITMVAFHVILFPRAGPDIKYLLGFIRTQLSTSVTIGLVFGPKVTRVIRGQGDQWDNRARARGVTASFSLNGIGLVAEETADLFQENEELKEELQKLASQIEFMRIVHMETNNRHLKPRPGSYFQAMSAQVAILQSPVAQTAGLFQKADFQQESTIIQQDVNEYV